MNCFFNGNGNCRRIRSSRCARRARPRLTSCRASATADGSDLQAELQRYLWPTHTTRLLSSCVLARHTSCTGYLHKTIIFVAFDNDTRDAAHQVLLLSSCDVDVPVLYVVHYTAAVHFCVRSSALQHCVPVGHPSGATCCEHRLCVEPAMVDCLTKRYLNQLIR